MMKILLITGGVIGLAFAGLRLYHRGKQIAYREMSQTMNDLSDLHTTVENNSRGDRQVRLLLDIIRNHCEETNTTLSMESRIIVDEISPYHYRETVH